MSVEQIGYEAGPDGIVIANWARDNRVAEIWCWTEAHAVERRQEIISRMTIEGWREPQLLHLVARHGDRCSQHRHELIAWHETSSEASNA